MADHNHDSETKRPNETTHRSHAEGGSKGGPGAEAEPRKEKTAQAPVPTPAPASGAPTVPGAPTLTGHTTPTSVTVQWAPIPGAATYAVQMSTTPSKADSWTLLSNKLKTPAMRKKNLPPGTAHFFRVRAVSEAGEWMSSWSSPSEPVSTAGGINPIFRNLLGGKVLQNAKGKPGKAAPVDLHELGSGLIALYFSASWCPPCRKFTPMLEQFHATVRQQAGPGKFEVVFVSSDQDQTSFEEYFANHHGTWFALPFEAQHQRQQCGSYFKVEGIPRLIVFGPDGKIVCGNAVGQRLDMATLAQWQAAAGMAK